MIANDKQERYHANMLYIGTDAGATKTHTVLSDGTKIIANDDGGPANHHVVGWNTAVKEITMTIKNVLIKTGAHHEELSICVGMAGIDSQEEANEAVQKIRDVIGRSKKIKLIVVNDTEIALAAGTENPNAIILICGTGANCIARNDEGKKVKIGGYDYLLSDEASGYMMGTLALRSAAKSFDGRGTKTIIEELLLKKLCVNSFTEAQKIFYQKNWGKNDIAECALLVFEAAQKDDEVANNIINQTVNEAVLMVTTAQKKIQREICDIVCSGGLFKNIQFKTKCEQEIKKALPKCLIIFPTQNPAWGAIRLAMNV